jgi:hypothetical protein
VLQKLRASSKQIFAGLTLRLLFTFIEPESFMVKGVQAHQDICIEKWIGWGPEADIRVYIVISSSVQSSSYGLSGESQQEMSIHCIPRGSAHWAGRPASSNKTKNVECAINKSRMPEPILIIKQMGCTHENK